MKKSIILIAVVLIVGFLEKQGISIPADFDWNQNADSANVSIQQQANSAVQNKQQSTTFKARTDTWKQASTTSVESAFRSKRSDIQVQGEGVVIKVLPDDLKGSRHQKFILKMQSGHTVLFAHNIDLAAKIQRLQKGDAISFNGEYEWGDRGGVIHWTHHDPAGRHINGWLKHQGKTYQ